jgi:RHS repeat-associated protein
MQFSTTPSVYNEYVVDLSGRAITAIQPGTSNVYTAEVFAGGRHWVTDNGSALFLGADWLGTTRALTNLSGTFDQLYTSLPWGDGLSSGGSSFHTTSQYTGKEYDPESGLYHFPARQYAPVQGRWLTPDPAGISAMRLDSPQSWNRYAYVLNNPLSNIDPTGLYPGRDCDTADPGCSGDGGAPGDGDSADCPAEFSNCSGYYYEGLSIPGSTAAQLLSLGAFTVAGAGPGSSVSINGQLWTFIAWGGTSAGVLYGGAFLGGSSTDWGNWVGFGGTSIPGSMTAMIPGSGWISAAGANNPTTSTPQKQPWPYKDPSSCSAYGSGNLLNFVCKNAGTTPYANSARGCLLSYWDSGTGTYSMTQGGPGVPWKPIDQAQSVFSFANSHAICLVGAMFY